MAGALLFSCSKDKTDDTGKPGKPVIVVTETQGLSLTAEAGSAELHYTVENATEEGVVGAECPASWIELTNSDEPGVIRFNYAANLEADSRNAVITLTYPGAENVAVNVTQLRTEKWVIDLDVQVVDAFNADISIVSTEKEMSYVMLNLTKEDFARFASDNELTAYYLDLFRSVADSYGISLGSLLSQLLYTGDINGKLNNLTPETEYVAIAFGLTTDATVTSEVFSEEYTTPAPPFYSEGIAIDVETLKPNYMNLKLTPGLNDYRYYADVMSQQEVDAYGSLEEWKQIPSKWEDFEITKFDKDNSAAEQFKLDHGYDESKPESELDIEDMKQAAKFRGGECLSDSMTKGDLATKLKWKCGHCGAEFEASPALILLGGHWCPECYIPQKAWDYDAIAKTNPFFAQVWYPNHKKDENNRYDFDELFHINGVAWDDIKR